MFGDKDPAPVMEPFSALMARAEAAKRKKDWKLAISLFDTAKVMWTRTSRQKATCHLSNAGVPCVLTKSDDKDMFMLAQAMAILTPLA